MNVSARRNEGWTNYWKEARIASCVPESDSTEAEIRDYWINRFTQLPDGSRVLDVATGNGVLLAYAAMAAERGNKKFDLTGIDLADIDPQRYVPEHPAVRAGARFIGGTDAENLPFAEGEFDAVVSQYGLEYADLDRALAEIERITAHGGRLMWLAHSPDSSVVAQNRDQSDQVEFLLADAGPLQAMQQFIAAAMAGTDLQQATASLRAALKQAERYCRDHPPAKIVNDVCSVLAQTAQRWQAYYPSDLRQMLDDSERKLGAHRQRINDLIAAVISPARATQARRRLREPGWQEVSVATLRVGSDASPIGIMIEAKRSAVS